ncbi:hypothetical protein V7S43_012557 [Phytophthora oleae]|uniref:Ankyrin repeat protein n=1 Tax=Phytophthora oleae TaxID=2107226 RepID=A0ABD3F6W4_9STRA
MKMPSDDTPVFTSARVVCRECLPPRELPHVVLRFDTFLKRNSVLNACILGSLRLMSYAAYKDTKADWDNMAYVAAKYGHVDILQMSTLIDTTGLRSGHRGGKWALAGSQVAAHASPRQMHHTCNGQSSAERIPAYSPVAACQPQ